MSEVAEKIYNEDLKQEMVNEIFMQRVKEIKCLT